MGIARYFNGTDWTGPIEYNIEHTPLMPGNIGPVTSEMGTVAWYGDDENNKLYAETLARLKPFLAKARFKGDFGLNCIVNDHGAFILEATSRLGSPIVHLQTELHDSKWGEFLYAIARGQTYDLRWKKGYGIVVLVAVPPFPYLATPTQSITPHGIDIHFKNMSDDDRLHVHFDEVAKRIDSDQLYIADNKGYICYVTGIGETVEGAQEKVYGIVNKIVLPRMIYRNDIGSDFDEHQLDKLKEWGYIR
jgi:phosphoribosylamine--glycine ligase